MAGDLAFASIVDLGRLLRARKTSATELAKFFLDRLERLGPAFGAVVTVTRERALAEAAQADREIRRGAWRGPLHGIPYGVKDLLAAKGYPTTWGATPYKDQTIDADATVVARLAAAGAVLCAKLAMVELAGGMGYNQANASFTGPGKTPWNPDYWSGGSSSGPGAAVAAGLVPFAIGSETSGSILTPAAYCGVTGLRPTYGRVSRHGAMALSWTMDKLGPLGRSAEDCALVLAAVAGADPLDPSAAARTFQPPVAPPRRPARRFRLGVLKGADTNIQTQVAFNFRASLEALQDAVEVVEDVELPDLPYGVVGGTIIAVEGSSAFDDLFQSGKIADLTAPEDRRGGYPALAIPARDYVRALRLRRPMQKAFDEVLKKFDALATPTRGTVASPVERPFRDAWPGVTGGGGANIIGPANVVGVPAISVPNGFGLNDLPTGLCFTGRAFDEAKLVRLGRLYQARTDWHRRQPAMA
jgi:Asp-tRNA(Asn)/Glu-tRNA(Gln) amidotransferase A subunit family amidase